MHSVGCGTFGIGDYPKRNTRYVTRGRSREDFISRIINNFSESVKVFTITEPRRFIFLPQNVYFLLFFQYEE